MGMDLVMEVTEEVMEVAVIQDMETRVEDLVTTAMEVMEEIEEVQSFIHVEKSFSYIVNYMKVCFKMVLLSRLWRRWKLQ